MLFFLLPLQASGGNDGALATEISNQEILRDLVEERVFEKFLRNFSLRTVKESTKELIYDQASNDKTAQSRRIGRDNRYVLKSPVEIGQNSIIEVTASRERHCSNASFKMEVVENNNRQKDDKIQNSSMLIRYQARKSASYSELTVQKISKIQNFANSSGGRAKILTDRYFGTEFHKGLILKKDLGDRFVYQFIINQRLEPGEMIGIGGLDLHKIISINAYTNTRGDFFPKLEEHLINGDQYGSLDNKNSSITFQKDRIIFRPKEVENHPTEVVEVTIHVSKRGLGPTSRKQPKLELSVILMKPRVVIAKADEPDSARRHRNNVDAPLLDNISLWKNKSLWIFGMPQKGDFKNSKAVSFEFSDHFTKCINSIWVKNQTVQKLMVPVWLEAHRGSLSPSFMLGLDQKHGYFDLDNGTIAFVQKKKELQLERTKQFLGCYKAEKEQLYALLRLDDHKGQLNFAWPQLNVWIDGEKRAIDRPQNLSNLALNEHLEYGKRACIWVGGTATQSGTVQIVGISQQPVSSLPDEQFLKLNYGVNHSLFRRTNSLNFHNIWSSSQIEAMVANLLRADVDAIKNEKNLKKTERQLLNTLSFYNPGDYTNTNVKEVIKGSSNLKSDWSGWTGLFVYLIFAVVNFVLITLITKLKSAKQNHSTAFKLFVRFLCNYYLQLSLFLLLVSYFSNQMLITSALTNLLFLMLFLVTASSFISDRLTIRTE